ncbi:MAG: hypothetical protein ACOVQM_20315 [Pirellula sp.]
MQSTAEETLPKVAKEVNESMEAGLIDSVLMKLQSFQNERELGSLCVGIASCDSGCGATTIAARLAAQAAMNGMGNVLLVDANYNRPAVHRRFRVKRGPGLLDSLVKGLDVPECIQPTDHAELNLMTLGSKELSTQLPVGHCGSTCDRSSRLWAILCFSSRRDHSCSGRKND